jgi:hypothetical protein
VFVRRRGATLRRGAVAAALGLCLLLLAQVAGALSYYQAGPRGTLGVSRPVLQQQFMLRAGEAISSVAMQLDGGPVPASWDETGLITYTPGAPLAPGRHTVRVSVQVGTGTSGWFYDPVVSEFSFVVGPDAVESLPAPGLEELRALAEVNGYRRAAGEQPMVYSAPLGAAAQRHARYLAAHDQERETNPHAEQPGTALFSGASPGDRARFFGYVLGTDEVINFTDRAEMAVAGWMDTLYHRIPLLHPGSREMGYGLGGSGDSLTDVLLTGPNGDAEGTVAWPYPDQTGVPTGWDGAEFPDPLALYPGARGPVGYTVSLTFGGSPAGLTLEKGTLTGPDGDVPVYTYAPGMDPNLSDTVALIPESPLRAGSSYTVFLSGQVNWGAGAVPYERRWSFTTATEHRPLLLRRISNAAADGTVRRITVEGSGLGEGMRVFLGGLPVEQLSVDSPTLMDFQLPVGYTGGAADLLVVTPGGWESSWPGFFSAEQWVRTRNSGPAFTEAPLLVNGKAWAEPALLHVSGAILLPADLLAAFGGRRSLVPEIARSYWTVGGRSLDYTQGRTAASLDGRPVSLTLPVRNAGGRTYVEGRLLAQAVGMGVRATGAGVLFGLLDVDGHWAREQILQLVNAGIISGTGDGLFQPDQPLSRAAFVKMLVGARSLALQPGADGGFQDTAATWVARQGYIGAAVQAGIVVAREYPGGRFEPDRPITREEMAVMVTRALGLEGRAAAHDLNVAGGAVALDGKLFTDAGRWSRPGYIAVAVEEGIITGYGEPGGGFTFRPARQATRAEATVMLLRTMEHE